jgi:DNA primase large subunit
MASNKTVVKGIRASQEFFDKCDLVAKAEGVDRNKLIVRVVSEYCDGLYKSLITEWEENYTYVVKHNIVDNNKPCEYPFVECKYLMENENGNA